MKTRLLVIVGILIIAFAAMIAPVMAASSATITGNPEKAIAIDVQGTIADWVLTPGATETDATSVTLAVSSNSPGWVVSVKDALDVDGVPAAKPNAGFMVDYLTTGGGTWGTTKLGTALTVNSANAPAHVTGASHVLTGADQAIETGISETGGTGVFAAHAITLSQPVAYTDTILGTNHVYRIIVTFTGTTP